jgi:hypothetical protein
MKKTSIKPKSQNGATLILMAFLIGLMAAAYALKVFNVASEQLDNDTQTLTVLNNAKKSLIAWSVSHENRPGQMPFPDRNSDGDYDGTSDCNSPTSTFSYTFLIGQLPIYGQRNPCVSPQRGIGSDFLDAQGNRLWYAVSRNLVHKYEIPTADPIINPGIVSTPVYPWLRVLDRNGNLISDRVAAVIIAPGNPLGLQNRSGSAPSINQYLDSLQIGSVTFSNANYLTANEDFIVGLDTRAVTEADTTYVKPYFFNDKLIYITIDELMAALERRVDSEIGTLLKQYNVKNGRFPYAANLGASLNNHSSNGTSQKGMVPIDGTDSCSCSLFDTCTCSFNPIISVAMRRASGTWNSALDTGSCSSNGTNTCTCTGEGSCSRILTNFSCNASGVCTHTSLPLGTNEFIYTLPDYADVNNVANNCTASGNQAICTSFGSFNIGLKEPAWIKTNFWQDYLYYEWSAAPDIQIGPKSNITALLINTGEPNISEIGRVQIRASNDIRDYLDDAENTDNDMTFSAFSKQRTNNYNDQPFVIAP